MSKCNKSALISLERELKNNVNTDELIDMLEEPAGGFMTEREKMSVYEQPNQREKVGRIITLLRGKGDRDFDIFIQLLKDSGNAVWARQLEEKADDFRNIIGGWSKILLTVNGTPLCDSVFNYPWCLYLFSQTYYEQ